MNVTRLTNEQLEYLIKRSEQDRKHQVLKALLVEKKRRGKLFIQAKAETQTVPDSHPEKAVLIQEIETRFRLLLLTRSDSRYDAVYHQWFRLREEGLEKKLYQGFIPVKKEVWETSLRCEGLYVNGNNEPLPWEKEKLEKACEVLGHSPDSCVYPKGSHG